MTVQCQSCGGTYAPVLADGMLYFHRCPPLSAAELAAAVKAGAVTLPIDPVTKVTESAAVAVDRRVYERATRRDENVTDRGEPKSIGHGVLPVADEDVTPAVVAVDVPPVGPALPPVT